MDDNGSCPNCGKDFNGGLIWDHFYNDLQLNGYWMSEDGEYLQERRLLVPAEAAIVADKIAENYGATRTSGRWGLQIGIEYDRDRIEEWMCPDCKHTWPR